MKRFCMKWSVAVGLLDALTGVALVLSPGWVLGLLEVRGVPDPALVFLRWIGVFVASVGLAYAWVFRGSREAEAVWAWTATVRVLVAAFVTTGMLAGALEAAWWGVAATDAFVAGVQLVGIRRRWWR